MKAENTLSTLSTHRSLLGQIIELKIGAQSQCEALREQMQHRNLSHSLQLAIEVLSVNDRCLREAMVQMKQQKVLKEEARQLQVTLEQTVLPDIQITLINAYRNEIGRLLLVIQQIRAQDEMAEKALALAKVTAILCEQLQEVISLYATEQPEQIQTLQTVRQSAYHLSVLVHLGLGLQYELRHETVLANQYFEKAWLASQHDISLADTDRALLLFSLLSHENAELVAQVKKAISHYCQAEQLPLQLLMYQKRGAELSQKQQYETARLAYGKAQHLGELNADIAGIGYSQLAIGHTFVGEFQQHIKIYSQGTILRSTQDQLLQKAFLLFLQGLNDLATQSNKTLARASDEGWIKQTYYDLETISQQYTEWAKKTNVLAEKKSYLEKTLDVRETLVDFFSLLKNIKRDYLESKIVVSHQFTQKLSSIQALEKDNMTQIAKLKAGISFIEKQIQQQAEERQQQEIQLAELKQQREMFYEQFKCELEAEEEHQQKLLAEKAEQQRKKSTRALAQLVHYSTTPQTSNPEKSRVAAKQIKPEPSIPLSKSNQFYDTGCQLLQQHKSKDAESAYQLAYTHATNNEILLKANAQCGLAECYNQQAHDLLKVKKLPDALALFRKASQQVIEALGSVNELIGLKRRGKTITESLVMLQNICFAIEIVVESTQRVLVQTESYWAKRYLLLKAARDRAFSRITEREGIAYWYRNKPLDARSPAANELFTCSQYYHEVVLTEEKIASVQVIAQHLRKVMQTAQWTHYDLKTTERLNECQQQLAEVEEAFNPPSVSRIPTFNQSSSETLNLDKAVQEKVKQSANPLLLKGIITTSSLTIIGSIKLPKTIEEILERLQQASYVAFVVGGCVRDLLLNKLPKDFDLITTAPLDVLKHLFEQGQVSQHIGNLFKLIQNNLQIDIIIFSDLNLEADAAKRDFTVNALYADAKGQIFDPLDSAMNHLKSQKIIFIAESNASIKEDPLRLMRLAHLIVETDWQLAIELQLLVTQFAPLILTCETGRLYFECRKHFLQGKAIAHYHTLYQLNLFQVLFPSTSAYLAQETVGEYYQPWLLQKLQSTDERVQSGKSVSLDYIFAIFEVGYLFWHHPDLHTDINSLKQVNTSLINAWYRQFDKSKKGNLIPHFRWVQELANDYFCYQSQAKKTAFCVDISSMKL